MTDNSLRESLRNLVAAAEAVLNDEPHSMAALRMATIAAQLELEGPRAAIAEAERRRLHHQLGGSAETFAAIEAIEKEKGR